jgi:hypothetical protein
LIKTGNNNSFTKGNSKTQEDEENKMTNISDEGAIEVVRTEVYPVNGPMTPGIKEEMLKYQFWTSRLDDGNKILMDHNSIMKFNSDTIEKINEVYDLESYLDTLTKKELTDMIKEYKLPEKPRYDDNGKLLGKEFYNSLIKNINLETIKDQNTVRYGVTVRKASLRSFPTDAGAYDNAQSTALDRFQETASEPCEAVLVLHESKDKKWYFVQMYNYRGWAKAEDIAIGKDKQEVFSYTDSDKFIMVTGNHVYVNDEYAGDTDINKEFSMGDRIPVILGGELFNKYEKENYVIKLPVRTDEGRLQFKNALIAKSKDAVYGYLPYTRENIIKEAFKLQGDRYDWGNKYNGRDCSSFIANIYKTFGFLLPRNADEQEMSIGKQYKFLSTDTIETRNKILDNVKPGAAIFKPGHVMMYLGKADGVHYMIHDFTSYGKKQGNQYVSTPVFSVGVTSTTLTLSTGDPYIQTFTSALQMEN